MSNKKPKNPMMNYYGGKYSIAKWVISHFPHKSYYRIYNESFGGVFSVGFQKDLVAHNYYNDIDGRLVNIMTQVRDNYEELMRLLMLTPFSRKEFESCIEPSDDPIEDARRLFVVLNQVRKGSSTTTASQWKRSKTSNTSVCNAFYNKVKQLDIFCDILRHHYIESKPAIDLIKELDTPETLHYIDPPYVKSTRSNGNVYVKEMDNKEHVDLLELVKELNGFVVISGYDNELYQKYIGHFWRFQTLAKTLGDPSCSTVETLWTNYEPALYKEPINKTKMNRLI